MNYYLKVLKQYADFEGRARRSEYWFFALFSTIISIAISYIGLTMNAPVIGTIYSLAVLVPSIAVAIRRMHDVDKSGWYCLIPFYNIILAFTEGTKGPNEYGPDPKDPDATAMYGGDSGLLDDKL
jgi:uncharacterized membrane protein YhaH (DUF805 family)